MKSEREQAQKNIAENRKAFHDYHILETFEAGLVLLGTEVKSIRGGNVNLRDSYARVEGGEVAIGLAKGKKEHDKRETIKRREADRETRAAVKERRSR